MDLNFSLTPQSFYRALDNPASGQTEKIGHAFTIEDILSENPAATS